MSGIIGTTMFLYDPHPGLGRMYEERDRRQREGGHNEWSGFCSITPGSSYTGSGYRNYEYQNAIEQGKRESELKRKGMEQEQRMERERMSAQERQERKKHDLTETIETKVGDSGSNPKPFLGMG